MYCNVKEKDHITRIINSKKRNLICKISNIIILIYQKLGLPSPYHHCRPLEVMVQMLIKLPGINKIKKSHQKKEGKIR